MSLHLQRIRLYVTTKDAPNAGTDSGVELWYFVKTARLTNGSLRVRHGWKKWELDNPWDDRERGRTDLYQISLEDLSDVGQSIGGQQVPRGVAFQNFDDVRLAPFYLKIKGDDWWEIDSYVLYGLFKEMLTPIPSGIINHGWLPIAQLNSDVELSEDVTEGSRWHQILINGNLGFALPVRSEAPATDAVIR